MKTRQDTREVSLVSVPCDAIHFSRIGNTMKPNKNKPSVEEKKMAMELQAPTKPEAIQTLKMFSWLLKQPTVNAAELLGAGKDTWINSMDDVNPLFPTGADFSRPFFVLKAWYFESKTAVQKSRIALKMALPDERVYHISLTYPMSEESGEALYSDREIVLNHFANSSQPVGLMQFEKIDRGQSNAYWRLIYSDSHSMELAGETGFLAEESAVSDGPF